MMDKAGEVMKIMTQMGPPKSVSKEKGFKSVPRSPKERERSPGLEEVTSERFLKASTPSTSTVRSSRAVLSGFARTFAALMLLKRKVSCELESTEESVSPLRKVGRLATH
jgi:hypothetical protein